MNLIRFVVLVCLLACGWSVPAVEVLHVVVPLEMQPAMQALVARYRDSHPELAVDIVAAPSRQAYADIKRGAPVDVFFAANVSWPKRLADEGEAAGPPAIYAMTRLVLWSISPQTTDLTLERLAERQTRVVAIPSAETTVAGQRAAEVLRKTRLWGRLQGKLVEGHSVLETAQFVRTGSAGAAIVTAAVLHRPEFAGHGAVVPVPVDLYRPIRQAVVVTRRGQAHPEAHSFVEFVLSPAGRDILALHGFEPGDGAVVVK